MVSSFPVNSLSTPMSMSTDIPMPLPKPGLKLLDLPNEIHAEILRNISFCRHQEMKRVCSLWKEILDLTSFKELQSNNKETYKEYNGLPLIYNVHVAGEYFAKVQVSFIPYIPYQSRRPGWLTAKDKNPYDGFMMHQFLMNISHDVRFIANRKVCPYCGKPAEVVGVYRDGPEYYIPGTEKYFYRSPPFVGKKWPDTMGHLARNKKIPEFKVQLPVPTDKSYDTFKEDPIWRTQASRGLLRPEQLSNQERATAFHELEFEFIKDRYDKKFDYTTGRSGNTFTIRKPYGEYFTIEDMMKGFQQWMDQASPQIPCASCFSKPPGWTCIVS